MPAEENALVLTLQQQHDDALDIGDVIGKRILSTRLRHNVTVREKNALAALEVMSRFAANPKWLIVVYSPLPVLNIPFLVMIFAPCNLVLHCFPLDAKARGIPKYDIGLSLRIR